MLENVFKQEFIDFEYILKEIKKKNKNERLSNNNNSKIMFQ